MLLTLPLSPFEPPPRRRERSAEPTQPPPGGRYPHPLDTIVAMHNDMTDEQKREAVGLTSPTAVGPRPTPKPGGMLWTNVVVPYNRVARIRHDDGTIGRYAIRPGAFDLFMKLRSVSLRVDHDPLKRLCGTDDGTLLLWSTANGLYAGTRDWATAHALSESPRVQMSPGWNPHLQHQRHDAGGPYVEVVTAELVEVSIVTAGAFFAEG